MAKRRRRGVRVRRQVRRLEIWPVIKLALAFHLACGLVTLGALSVLWAIGRQLGVIDRLARFLEDVGFARDFEIQGPVLLRGGLMVVGALVLLNTVITVVLAFLYNSLSGVMGGLIFSVLEEQPRVRLPPEAEVAAPVAAAPPARSRRRAAPATTPAASAPAPKEPTRGAPPRRAPDPVTRTAAATSTVASPALPVAPEDPAAEDWLKQAREVG